MVDYSSKGFKVTIGLLIGFIILIFLTYLSLVFVTAWRRDQKRLDMVSDDWSLRDINEEIEKLNLYKTIFVSDCNYSNIFNWHINSEVHILYGIFISSINWDFNKNILDKIEDYVKSKAAECFPGKRFDVMVLRKDFNRIETSKVSQETMNSHRENLCISCSDKSSGDDFFEEYRYRLKGSILKFIDEEIKSLKAIQRDWNRSSFSLGVIHETLFKKER